MPIFTFNNNNNTPRGMHVESSSFCEHDLVHVSLYNPNGISISRLLEVSCGKFLNKIPQVVSINFPHQIAN